MRYVYGTTNSQLTTLSSKTDCPFPSVGLSFTRLPLNRTQRFCVEVIVRATTEILCCGQHGTESEYFALARMHHHQKLEIFLLIIIR